MKRIEQIRLHFGPEGLRFIAVSPRSSAGAQSNVPPPDVPAAPASTATSIGSRATGYRHHRFAHPPRSAVQDQPIVFVDQEDMRRPASLGQRRPAAPAELGRRPQRQVQQLGQPRQPARRRRRRRRLGRNRPALSRLEAAARAGRRPRYVNGASASGVPGATDLNSIPER